MLIITELICAFDAYILLTARRDWTTSFARIRHTSFWPFFAASFSDRFTLSSSRWIPEAKVASQSATRVASYRELDDRSFVALSAASIAILSPLKSSPIITKN